MWGTVSQNQVALEAQGTEGQGRGGWPGERPEGREQVPGQVDVRAEGGGGNGGLGRTRGLAEIRRERLIPSMECPKMSGRHRPKGDPLDGTKCC